MARHRQANYIGSVVSSFRLDEFKCFFRVSRTSVEYLIEMISRICVEEGIVGITIKEGSGGSPQVPLDQRVLLFLWYMSSLDKYSSVADRFGLSESTACSAIHNLLQFLQDHLTQKLIVWPTREEQREMQDMYMDLHNFPGVVGMLDGTHIAIRRPKERGIDYFNRKDYYSTVLQGCVREDLRFIDICTGWPGKVHDARIFQSSPLYSVGQDLCGESHILADSAYPILPWVLTPFRDNGQLTQTQKKYNQKHSAIRSAVERAFGLLKGRFTRLQYLDQRNNETIISTVVCACILHNICIINNDEFQDIAMDDTPVPQELPNTDNFDANAQESGSCKRLNIARQL